MMRIITTTLTLILVLTCGSTQISAQQQKRPARGSIRFGRQDPPIVWNEAAIAPVRDVFRRIAENVVPSVVSILPTRVDTVIFYRNPFYRFFGEDPFGFFGPDEERPQRRERRSQGLGSGVIVSPQGYVLTNFHVVAGAQEIEVHLSDGRVFEAQIVGADSLSDVAAVKLTGKIPGDLPVAYLGNSDSLRAGDLVAAIGNPFSLMSTITSGIVSALGRRVQQDLTYQSFIQTDAAINPGNSGGALVDIRGGVMGINTLIFSQTGGFMGIGFAIPVNLARRVMEDLIYEGRVIRGWIGITVQEITPELRKAFGIADTAGGVLVGDVVEGQPAARAGIRPGDIILSVEDRKVSNPNELVNIIAALRPGHETPVTLLREGKRLQLKVKTAERTPQNVGKAQPGKQEQPPQGGGGESDDKVGIGVQALTRELAEQLGLPGNASGVVVTDVSPGVSDARKSLQPGDVITRIKVQGRDWTDIKSVNDYRKLTGRIREGQSVVLQVTRQGSVFFVSFTL